MMDTNANVKYLMSSTALPLSQEIVIYGPPGVGKTFAAATISEHWPEKWPPEKRVELLDMLWLVTDAGALDGMREGGVSVPAIDVRGMLNDLGPVKGAYAAAELMVQTTRSNTAIKAVVLDTITTLDLILHEYFNKQFADDEQKWVLYRELLCFHKRFHSYLRLTGRRVITLAHANVVTEAQDETGKRKQIASKLPDGGNVQVAITGKGRSIYINDGSLVLPMRAFAAKGQPTKRAFYPRGKDGMEGKNRFQLSLSDEEPANLRAALAKINARIKAAEGS